MFSRHRRVRRPQRRRATAVVLLPHLGTRLPACFRIATSLFSSSFLLSTATGFYLSLFVPLLPCAPLLPNQPQQPLPHPHHVVGVVSLFFPLHLAALYVSAAAFLCSLQCVGTHGDAGGEGGERREEEGGSGRRGFRKEREGEKENEVKTEE